MLSYKEPISHFFDTAVQIIPIADVHLGNIQHNSQAWNGFLSWLKASENTYIVLLGDLINNGVRGAVGNPFDEVLRPRDQKRLITEQLLPIRDKILAILPGNHEARSIKDDDADITYDIACRLEIEHLYREHMAFMRVGVGKVNASRKRPAACTYTFCMAHGSGGGIWTGSTATRQERFAGGIEGVDCLITGHTHKPLVAMPSKLCYNPTSNVVVEKSYITISATPWLAYGGYAAEKMLLPGNSCRPQILKLSANEKDRRIVVEW